MVCGDDTRQLIARKPVAPLADASLPKESSRFFRTLVEALLAFGSLDPVERCHLDGGAELRRRRVEAKVTSDGTECLDGPADHVLVTQDQKDRVPRLRPPLDILRPASANPICN